MITQEEEKKRKEKKKKKRKRKRKVHVAGGAASSGLGGAALFFVFLTVMSFAAMAFGQDAGGPVNTVDVGDHNHVDGSVGVTSATRPAIRRNRVVLPAPLGPTTATSSPGWTFRRTSRVRSPTVVCPARSTAGGGPAAPGAGTVVGASTLGSFTG